MREADWGRNESARHKGLLTVIFQLQYGVGMALGPLIGGFLSDIIGYRELVPVLVPLISISCS